MPSRPATRPASWPLLYLAVALTAAATVVFAFSMLRILAVVYDRPRSFTDVSLAALGLALGGLLASKINKNGDPFQLLGVWSLVTSALVVAGAFAVISRYPHEVLAILAIALPFAGAGMTFATALGEGIERAGKVCGYTLLGAACGCVGFIALLNGTGAPNTVIAVSVLFSAAGAIWFSLGGRRIGRIAGVGAGLFFTLLVIANTGLRFLNVHYKNGIVLQEQPFVRWNWISRISLGTGAEGDRIYVDAVPAMRIVAAEPGRDPGVAHLLRPGAKTLVLGAGGGSEVADAIGSGSQDVTAVEVNPLIANTVMQRRFPELSGGLFLKPEVHVVVEDARSFIRRTDEMYGVVAFGEHQQVTAEMLKEYLAHLAPGGILTVTRRGPQPVVAAARALDNMSDGASQRPLVVTASDGRTTMILTRQPLTEAEQARIAARVVSVPNESAPAWPMAALLGCGVAVAGLSLLRSDGAPAVFFQSIGIGYVLILSALLGQLTLFLGHPTYGLTVALVSILLATASGSFASKVMMADNPRLAVIGAAVVVAMTAILLPAVLSLCFRLPLEARMLITFAAVVPMGFAMGLPLPAALQMAGSGTSGTAWSAHAAGAVFGIVAAAALGTLLGHTATMLVGAALYLLAFAIPERRNQKSY